MKVKAPFGVTAISIAGESYNTREDGTIEIPDDALETALEIGCEVVHGGAIASDTVEAEPKPKKGKGKAEAEPTADAPATTEGEVA